MANHLFHYGVLGQRWGIRRNKSSGGSLKSRLSAHYQRSVEQKYGKSSTDSKVAKSLKKKRLNELSNDELKKLTTRMQLEKQYKDLKRSNASAGKKFVTDILRDSGKNVATSYVTKILGNQVDSLLEQFPKK